MKKLGLSLWFLSVCACCLSQSKLEGEWKGSYVLNAQVQRIYAYIWNDGNEMRIDAPDQNQYDLKFGLEEGGDSVVFNRVNAKGILVEFKGVRKENLITGSVTMHNEYLKDSPGAFQLMKSRAKLFKGWPSLPFSLETYEGERISQTDFQDQYVMLDFWATWCKPCVAKRPKLEELKKTYGERLQIISISLDKDVKKLEKFRENRYPMPWYHVIKPAQFDDPFVKEYAPQGLPYAYLLGQDGKVLAFGNDLNSKNIKATFKRVME